MEARTSASHPSAQVRNARPNTIETRDQEQHVRAKSRIDGDPILDRLNGMMLGAAIGDALGSAFEFVSSTGIYDLIGSAVVPEFFEAAPGSLMFPRRRGVPTDDTAMTLALVDALTADDPPSPQSIQRAFGNGLRRQTGPYGEMFWNGGPGGACIAMLRVFDDGAAPFTALPKRWIEGLHYCDVVESAAHALYTSVALGNRSQPPDKAATDRADQNGGRVRAGIGSRTSMPELQIADSDRSAAEPLVKRVVLSSRFHRALMDAEFYHHEQTRKSTHIPYFSHLLGVCSLVLEAGGSETEAIAALLHDAPEDAGGAPVLAAIKQNFGTAVASIVEQLSNALPEQGAAKADWKCRKSAYIDHLRDADSSTLLVGAADKLHNLRAIQADYQRIGNVIFDRFSAPEDRRTNTLWYYRSLLEVYRRRDNRDRDPRLERLTGAMHDILQWFDNTNDCVPSPSS